jgi:light-regulated signal transduction histidine kinase (bacteriophytochrome)
MSIGASTQAALAPERAQRLLAALHHVCSHDLPNQAVALESLLFLFNSDESERLSGPAQEYLNRLRSVAHKISGMAQFLRDILRLTRHEPDVAPIPFDRFVTELKAEVQRNLPEHDIRWDHRLQTAAGFADRRLLLQAAAALVQAAADLLATKTLQITVTTKPEGTTEVQCRVTVAPAGLAGAAGATTDAGAAKGTVATAPLSTTTSIERRLEYTLAQEFLSLTGVSCRVDDLRGVVAFALTLPQRTSHA